MGSGRLPLTTITCICCHGNQGHIGSSSLGLDMLLDNDIIKEIVLMATNNPVFSIRGYHVISVYYAIVDHVICSV